MSTLGRHSIGSCYARPNKHDPPGARSVDIHKPKPWRGLREFVKEIGTIVLGVLIALAGEQAVERLEWAHKVHAAEDAMRAELLFDDGPQIYQRTAMHDCLTERLDAIRAGVESGMARADLVKLIDGYHLDFLTYDTLAHDDATHAGVADHMSQAALATWTNAYSAMPSLERTNAQEAQDVARLKGLRRTGGPLSEAEQTHTLDAVEALRVEEHTMANDAAYVLPSIRKLGPLDPGRMALFLNRAQAWYGAACVRDKPDGWRPA